MRPLHTPLVSRRSTARVRKVQQIIIPSRKSKPSDRGLDILILREPSQLWIMYYARLLHWR